MTALGHIFQPDEIRNTMKSYDLLVPRIIYVHGCQFGLVNFSDNQTGFIKFMNIMPSLFLAPIVVLVLVTGIPDVSLLVTRTLVPVKTTYFHVTFQLFNGISSPFVDGFFPIISPIFRHVTIFNTISPEYQTNKNGTYPTGPKIRSTCATWKFCNKGCMVEIILKNINIKKIESHHTRTNKPQESFAGDSTGCN